MISPTKSRQVREFGDFQTPPALTAQVCALLRGSGLQPASVIEPTCGTGNFLRAALDCFPTIREALGVEIDPRYVEMSRGGLNETDSHRQAAIRQANFFEIDWPALMRDFPEPLLIVGNPPWVTNADLGSLGSDNLPAKTNSRKLRGIDGITGKSNFDISEWMILRLLEAMDGRGGTLAMLCKTAVARKVLLQAWRNNVSVADSQVYLIDAAKSFGISASACLLVCRLSRRSRRQEALVYEALGLHTHQTAWGLRGGTIIADLAAYERWKQLQAQETAKGVANNNVRVDGSSSREAIDGFANGCRWRSGIKHDCAKVMELRQEGRKWRNGLGELVALEEDYLYPMLKGSELARGGTDRPVRWMLVTQRFIGEDTSLIRQNAPKTWNYLLAHGELLDRRASSVYRKRPRFSLFGVGEYSFSPWKVAIPGLYKQLRFSPVGSHAGIPVVLDDTSYFLPCESREQASYWAALLNSETARCFFSAFVFWDAKRPITVDLLRRIDLAALANELVSR
ncbi:MAG: SAM-dependent DNA methyltransferase [Desulfomonile tiedjei]|nr:SAM-dependent DNA methyltransferase [Desulfomonile tiedjei]